MSLKCASFVSLTCLVFVGLFVSGCTTSGGIHQFDPVPAVQVGQADLAPAAPLSDSKLIEAARESFRVANTAQESGDLGTARRHYSLMLERLLETDLDPAAMYEVREEFDLILTKMLRNADLSPALMPPDTLATATTPESVYSDFLIPSELPERVLEQIRSIEDVYPKDFEAGLGRSSKYLPYIQQEFEKAGLPRDLAWLAMVESLFTPRIVSRAGAGGMWQFMRGTARVHDLRVDEYVDERFDWQKSTEAAISYLSDLNTMFDGNWPLAISAYNMGENGLQRAIARNGGEKNLWKLVDTPPAAYMIRRETKQFYPKLLASVIVAREPQRYGLTPAPQKPDNVSRVTVKGLYSLVDLDTALGLRAGTLRGLNPALIGGITPPDGTYSLVIPAETRSRFSTALRKIPKSTGTVTHVVRSGETLSSIAKRYNVSWTSIKKLNNIRSEKRLQIGQRLIIIAGTNAGTYATTAGGVKQYKVRRGDSLSIIAKRERVTVSKLQAWNSLGRSTRIRTGDLLIVSDPAVPVAPIKPTFTETKTEVEPGEKILHTVRGGEFPALIAKSYGVRLDDLLRWNNLTMTSKIMVGQKLTVYGPNGSGKNVETKADAKKAEKPAAKQPTGTERVIHKVKKGENPSVIAKKYGVKLFDFMDWNKLDSRSIIDIGDEYVVYVPKKEDVAAEEPGEAPEPAEASVTEEKTEPDVPVEKELRKTVHKVSSGDNPWTIARKYKVTRADLYEWNGWEKDPVLHIGDEIVIYTE